MSTAAAAATPSDKQNLSPSQLNAVARRCPNLEELILQVRIYYADYIHIVKKPIFVPPKKIIHY